MNHDNLNGSYEKDNCIALHHILFNCGFKCPTYFRKGVYQNANGPGKCLSVEKPMERI